MKHLNTFEEYENNVWIRELHKKLIEIHGNIQKSPAVDLVTGNIDLKYDPKFMNQDYFIPQRDEKMLSEWRTSAYVHSEKFVVPVICPELIALV